MKNNPPDKMSNSFIQFVFDNIDFHVHTIEGYYTFHSMEVLNTLHQLDQWSNLELMRD